MRRLLWKEYYELRWYVIGLVASPYLLTFWGMKQKWLPREVYGFVFWVMAILLAFMASTRLSKEMHANHMSVQWLPINRWVIWLTKYVPGFLIALLLPVWTRWVVTVVYADPWYRGYTIDQGMASPEIMSAVYACTFAVSLFLPSMAAVLIGILIVILSAALLPSVFSAFVPVNAFYATLAALATAVCIGAWYHPAGAGVRSRAISSGAGGLLGLVPALAIGILVAIHSLGGLVKLDTRYDKYQAWQSMRHRLHSYPWASLEADDVASPDGRYIAHMAQQWTSKRPGNILEIVDAHGRSVIVPDPTAIPAAWLPNGNLLVYTGMVRRRVTLQEFDRRTNRLTTLASFPPIRAYPTSLPIQHVFPDPSGARAVMLVSPRVGEGTDLWLLDLRTKAFKLLQPGWSLSGRLPGDFAWDGDSLVVWRKGNYWRIPLDGSAPKRIKLNAKERSHG